MTNLSNIHIYGASLQYPMSVRIIDPICPQTILSMRVMLFRSVILCVTNIPSINCNNTLFCSDLNGKHASENLMSLLFIVIEINSRKFEKLSISRKFEVYFSDIYLFYVYFIFIYLFFI